MVLYRANSSLSGLGNVLKNLSDSEISSFSNMLQKQRRGGGVGGGMKTSNSKNVMTLRPKMLLLTCWAAAHWQWDSSFPDSEVWEILGGRGFSLHHSPYSPVTCTLGNQRIRPLLASAACLLPQPHHSHPVPPPPPPVLAHVLFGPLCPPAHPRLVPGPPFEGHHPHSFWEKPTHVTFHNPPFVVSL